MKYIFKGIFVILSAFALLSACSQDNTQDSESAPQIENETESEASNVATTDDVMTKCRRLKTL